MPRKPSLLSGSGLEQKPIIETPDRLFSTIKMEISSLGFTKFLCLSDNTDKHKTIPIPKEPGYPPDEINEGYFIIVPRFLLQQRIPEI
jgi:hypothetical protein